MSLSGFSEALRQWIAQFTGLTITDQNRAPVELAIRILAEGHRLSGVEYVQRLLEGRLPPQPFIDQVTTNESYFFRAGEQMRYTVEHLVPQCLARHPDRPVRILSLPCARGEEPCSLAMLLRERGLSTQRVRILAVDISERCIADARRGLYGPLALRRTPRALQARWFRPAGPDRFQLDPAITAMVDFRRLNLFGEVEAGLGGPFDVLFSENLLIYFDPATSARALAIFQRLLRPDGWLFVDHAEWNLPRGRFTLHTLEGCVGFRPGTGAAPPAPVTPAIAPPAPFPRPARRATGPAAAAHSGAGPAPQPVPAIPLLQEAEAHYHHKRFIQALAGFERLLTLPGATATRALLGKARVLADCGEDFEAMECAEQVVQRTEGEGPSPERPEALALLAVLLHKRGLHELAGSHLREVARLAPGHPALELCGRGIGHA